MNKAIIIGHLARDPEIKYTQSGKCVGSFTVAVNRPKRQGQEKSEADFIPVVAWDKLGEIVGNNLTKGRRVLVEGRMQVRSYETADKQRRYVTEVIAQNIEFLDSKKPEESSKGTPADFSEFGKDVFPSDGDEIPF